MVVLLNLVLVVGAWVTINPLEAIEGAEHAGIRSALWRGSEALWRKMASDQRWRHAKRAVDAEQAILNTAGTLRRASDRGRVAQFLGQTGRNARRGNQPIKCLWIRVATFVTSAV
jgi:hypothetical protein